MNTDKTKSLPCLLVDLGYDVFLGNNRGTTYSTGHTNLKNLKNNEAYWNYSFDELVKYDVPAFVNHILDVTSAEKIIYIGHS